LSDAGREQANALAEQLRDRAIELLVTSTEPKAEETGRIVAEKLGVAVEAADGLQEHDRRNVPFMPTREFISTVALFFTQPNRLVLGRETARDAKHRFESAVRRVMESNPAKNVAIVTHGTVLSLLVAEYANQDAFQLWRRMGLPSYVVMDWPALSVVEIVEKL
jgi:broad specificity phosphatase PhoE